MWCEIASTSGNAILLPFNLLLLNAGNVSKTFLVISGVKDLISLADEIPQCSQKLRK
jgi:hypothetical protein